jgi:hypothetical protein
MSTIVMFASPVLGEMVSGEMVRSGARLVAGLHIHDL